MDDLSSLDVFHDDFFVAAGTSSRAERKSNYEKRLEHFAVVRERRRRKRTEEHRRRNRRQRAVGRESALSYYKIPTLTVAIDLGFTDFMSVKEIRKLSRQIGRIWGLQKRFRDLSTTLTSPSDGFLTECRRVLTGFDNYDWPIVDELVRDRFVDRRIVYLSPDAGLPPLLDVDPDSVYVIGGLVDESGKGSQTKQRADDVDCECFRLPIAEFMRKSDAGGSFNVMLPINLVVEILCKYAHSRDWPSVLCDAVPRRIGYIVK